MKIPPLLLGLAAGYWLAKLGSPQTGGASGFKPGSNPQYVQKPGSWLRRGLDTGPRIGFNPDVAGGMPSPPGWDLDLYRGPACSTRCDVPRPVRFGGVGSPTIPECREPFAGGIDCEWIPALPSPFGPVPAPPGHLGWNVPRLP